MKITQPELGQKITELRKAKGWTQEELVEKCNISVRTIQRIETGEVIPRSYTIKTILSALDYEVEKIFEGESDTSESEQLSGMSLTRMNLAWLSGIIYFLLTFFEAAAEFLRFDDDELMFGTTGYVLLKVFLLISFVLFQQGFFVIADMFANYLLKVISVVLILTTVLVLCYDIASVFYDSFEREFLLPGFSVLFGATGIVFGLALRRLEKPLGSLAEVTGIIEIVGGVFYATVIFFIVGDLIRIPAELFEIIIIFKAIGYSKREGSATTREQFTPVR